MFLTSNVVSLLCHPPLILYSMASAFFYPMSDLIGVPGCLFLMHVLDVFIRIFALFFPLAIAVLRYLFIVRNMWVRKIGNNRCFNSFD